MQAALDFGMYDVRAPDAGYLLTLSLPGEDQDTCFYDKLDILEQQGMAASQPFTLRPRQAPPAELLAYLRLMNTRGRPLPRRSRAGCVLCASLTCLKQTSPCTSAWAKSMIDGHGCI